MKDSTTSFYSYVSLYITTKGYWLTLAVLPVKKGVSKVEYIRKFLAFISDVKSEYRGTLSWSGFLLTRCVLVSPEWEYPAHCSGEKTLTGTQEDSLGEPFPVRPVHDDGNLRTSRSYSAIDVQYLQGRNKNSGLWISGTSCTALTGSREGSIRPTKTGSLSNLHTVSGTSWKLKHLPGRLCSSTCWLLSHSFSRISGWLSNGSSSQKFNEDQEQ